MSADGAQSDIQTSSPAAIASAVGGGDLQASGMSGYQRWMIVLLFLLCTINFADRAVFAALAEPIKRDLGLSDGQLGLLHGLSFALLYSVLGIPLGWLTERTNRVRLLAVASILWSLMTAACGLATNMVQMLFARMGVGVGVAAFLPGASSLVADSFDASRRSSVMSLIMLGSTLGSFAGATAGGWIAASYDWRMAFYIIGLPGCIVALLTWATLREPGQITERRAMAVPLAGVFRAMIRKKSFVHLVIAGSLASMFVNIIGAFLGIFFIRIHGADVATAGLMIGLIAVFGISIGIGCSGFLVDRLRKRNLAWQAWVPAIGALMAFPLYWVALNIGGMYPAAAMIGLSGAFLTAYLGPSLALIQDIAGPGQRAAAIAFNALATSLIGVGLGPTIVGFLSDVVTNMTFTGQEYKAICLVTNHGITPPSACAAAERHGLLWALLACTPVLIWSAIHFYLSGRAYAAEARPPSPSDI